MSAARTCASGLSLGAEGATSRAYRSQWSRPVGGHASRRSALAVAREDAVCCPPNGKCERCRAVDELDAGELGGGQFCAAVLAWLLGARETGPVSRAAVREAAAACGVSERTLW